jgi:glutathione S-transferase
MLRIPNTRRAATQRGERGWRAALSDRPYRIVIASQFCLKMAAFAPYFAWPVYVTRELGLPGWLAGALFTMNALLVGFAQSGAGFGPRWGFGSLLTYCDPRRLRTVETMHVFHSPGSRSTRVLWALEEASAPYDVTVLTRDERRGEEHRRRHPLGRVPVIELDDGRVMFESAAICLHIADLYPDAGLAPAVGSADRPSLYQWLSFATTELEPAVGRWSRSRQSGDDEAERAEFFERAQVLEDRLALSPWIIDAEFSIADMFIARPMNVVFNNDLTDELPALKEHWQRSLDRPAHRRADAVGR